MTPAAPTTSPEPPKPPNRLLIDDVRRELGARASPIRAEQQQRYMKSALPFFGVAVPDVRRVARRALRAHPIDSRTELEATVRTLFDEVSHREEWYAALELWAVPRHARYRTPALVPLFEHVVVTAAWWDVVDDAATHVLCPTLVAHPRSLDEVVIGWADADDLWLRRAALLSQMGAKATLDLTLLSTVLTPNLSRREFFLRKAVGWALRDAARTEPDWVRGYLERHRDDLAPLSVKEASRHLV